MKRAWDWAIEQQCWTILEQLAPPLSYFCDECCYQEAGCQLFDNAIQKLDGDAPDELWDALLVRRCFLQMRIGHYKEAAADLKICLERRGSKAPTSVTVTALHHQSFLRLITNQFDEAYRYAQQSLTMARTLKDQSQEAFALRLLGIATGRSGILHRAILYGTQAHQLFRQIPDQLGEAFITTDLGGFYVACGDFERANQYLADAQKLNGELGQAFVRWHWALLCLHQGDFVAACAHACFMRDALNTMDSFWAKVYAWNLLGHGLLGLERYTEAAKAYHSALAIADSETQQSLRMESYAGLANAALQQNLLAEAQDHVQTILSHLNQGNLDGADDRFRVYGVCYRVLQRVGHEGSQQILLDGYDLLQTNADYFEDDHLRHCFLENVPSHREIVHLVEQMHIADDNGRGSLPYPNPLVEGKTVYPPDLGKVSSGRDENKWFTENHHLANSNLTHSNDKAQHNNQHGLPKGVSWLTTTHGSPHSNGSAKLGSFLSMSDQKLFGVATQQTQLAQSLRTENPPWLIALEGIGGIGKTSLAHKVVYEMSRENRFAQIAWLSAKQEEFLPNVGIRSVDQPALNRETLVDTLLDHLGKQPHFSLDTQAKERALAHLLKERPYLVVVDNLETASDIESVLPLLRQFANPTKILITSRFSLSGRADVLSILLGELSQGHTDAFIRHQAEISGIAPLQQADQSQLDAIYQVVGGNPLALKLIIGQLHFLPLSHVLESLKAAQGKRIDELYTYIYWQAWQMLDGVSRNLFLVLPLVPNGSFDELAAISELAPHELGHALEQLTRLSLVQVSGTLEQRTYQLHSLTETFLMNEVLKWEVAEQQ